MMIASLIPFLVDALRSYRDRKNMIRVVSRPKKMCYSKLFLGMSSESRDLKK